MLHKTVKTQRNTACCTVLSHVRIIIYSIEEVQQQLHHSSLVLVCKYQLQKNNQPIWKHLFLILLSEITFKESGYFIYFFFNSGVNTSYYVVLEG